MYYLPADFNGWFRLKGKSRRTFDTMVSTKSVFFKFRFCGFGGAAADRSQHPPPPEPKCAPGFNVALYIPTSTDTDIRFSFSSPLPRFHQFLGCSHRLPTRHGLRASYQCSLNTGSHFTPIANQARFNIVSQWNQLRRYQWPRGLTRRSAAERLLGFWVRIPPRAWMCVSCTVFVLSGRGLSDGPIPRPEKSYRLWGVWVWSSEN
jgi:hypothetical protein